MAGCNRVLVGKNLLNEVTDSLFYDEIGRIIKIRNDVARPTTVHVVYDTNNFPVRQFYESDVIENYAYEYRIKGDTLFQDAFPSELNYWTLNDSTFNYSKPEYVSFYLIKDGYIQEFNGKWNEIYSYDDFGRLVELAVYQDQPYASRQIYRYIGSSRKLNSQLLIEGEDTVQVIKYVNGILATMEEGPASEPFTSEFTLNYHNSCQPVSPTTLE